MNPKYFRGKSKLSSSRAMLLWKWCCVFKCSCCNSAITWPWKRDQAWSHPHKRRQKRRKKKKLPLDFELYNSSSRFLYFYTYIWAQKTEADWMSYKNTRKLALLLNYLSFNFIKNKKHYLLFLLIRNASKQPILAVDFICNFSTQRQVRDLSASTFCWVGSTFRLRVCVLIRFDSFTVFQWRKMLVNSSVRT